MVGVGHYLYLLATLKVSPSALQSPLNLTPKEAVTCKRDAKTFKKIVSLLTIAAHFEFLSIMVCKRSASARLHQMNLLPF